MVHRLKRRAKPGQARNGQNDHTRSLAPDERRFLLGFRSTLRERKKATSANADPDADAVMFEEGRP